MAILEIKPVKAKKKIIPLIMAMGNKIIGEIGLVEKIDEEVQWDKKRWKVSPGNLVKALILSTFSDIRAPLAHVSERFKDLDTNYLFGKDVSHENINEYNLGQSLDRISEIDANQLYETMAFSAITLNEIPMGRLHADTTTISFYGEYDVDDVDLTEEEEDELLKIERGYNKDGRPLDNQVVVGQIVNEVGIPIMSRVLDGSTSDVEWNKVAVKHLQNLTDKDLSKSIFVADSKLCTNELITSMNDPENRIFFVSRCPSSFENKFESRMIEKLYAGEMEELGQFSEGKKASKYKGKSFIELLNGQEIRGLALHSSALAEKATKLLEKIKEESKTLIKEIEKKKFACYADAENEWKRFEQTKKMRLMECVYHIEEWIEEKWPKGRRKAGTDPISIKRSYRIHTVETKENQEEITRFLRHESCIVIISNVMPEKADDRKLLTIYKGQQVVENSFRLLKEPCLASVIYLKNTKRIESLSMIFTLALLIRAILQFKMRAGLQKHQEEHPKEVLKAGWNGKRLENPTFKLLFEHTRGCYFETEKKNAFSFEWHDTKTEYKVMTLLTLMGWSMPDLL